MRRVERALVVGNLVEVAAALADGGNARRLYDWLLPFAGLVVTGMQAFCLGSVDRHLGMLASVLELWDEADEHFQGALRVDTALSSPPLLARTQYWYASLLLRCAGGDGDRAGVLLTQAASTAERLAMAALAAQVGALRSGL
jgi:hypothetical protein